MTHYERTISSYINRTTGLLRLLADPTRFHILLLLIKYRGGLAVYEIAEALAVTHSATSHQLGNLERGGLVEGIRDGQRIVYKLAKTRKARSAVRIIRGM